MIKQCESKDGRSRRCVYVSGHGGEHRYPNMGEGDLSNEIRLRKQLDDALAAKIESRKEAV